MKIEPLCGFRPALDLWRGFKYVSECQVQMGQYPTFSPIKSKTDRALRYTDDRGGAVFAPTVDSPRRRAGIKSSTRRGLT